MASNAVDVPASPAPAFRVPAEADDLTDRAVHRKRVLSLYPQAPATKQE